MTWRCFTWSSWQSLSFIPCLWEHLISNFFFHFCLWCVKPECEISRGKGNWSWLFADFSTMRDPKSITYITVMRLTDQTFTAIAFFHFISFGTANLMNILFLPVFSHCLYFLVNTLLLLMWTDFGFWTLSKGEAIKSCLLCEKCLAATWKKYHNNNIINFLYRRDS